jgi:hypothetical protein
MLDQTTLATAKRRIELGFGCVRFVTPAWLTIIGGALRRLKNERPDTHRRIVDFRQLSAVLSPR